MSYQKFQNCIASCSECAVACTHCANEDLNEENIKMLAHCIRLDYDCASACILAMKAMAGNSEFVRQICKICAEVCDACATECEKYPRMEHCRLCAEACRRCAAQCKRVVKNK